jgi:cell division septal protein FtsQ
VKWRRRFRLPRISRLPRASWRVLWWAAAAIVVMTAWTAAPLVLRRVAFFRVRQVELVGIRYLDADQLLAALRLAPHASVFDDTHVLADRLRGLEGVADVAVLRRPPGSLKVIVREVEPVALVANARGALTVVAADGRALPFELVSLDLPVVQAADSAVVGVLARVQVFDPALFQSIDAARRIDAQHDVALELGTRRVLLARDAGPEVIQAVVLVARDLAAKARPYAELDARFAGQVVVRRRSTGAAGVGGVGGGRNS